MPGHGGRLGQIALLLALAGGVAAVGINVAALYAPELIPDGAITTILTPFFVLAGFGPLLALLLLGIAARRAHWSSEPWRTLPLVMAIGFPLLTAVMGAAGALPGLNPVLAERLIEIPVVLSGSAWMLLGYGLWSAATRPTPDHAVGANP